MPLRMVAPAFGSVRVIFGGAVDFETVRLIDGGFRHAGRRLFGVELDGV